MRASRYGSLAIRSMLFAAICGGIVFTANPADDARFEISAEHDDGTALVEPRRRQSLVRRLRPTDPEAEDRMLA